MTDQLSLFGGETKATNDRLFLALFPPSDVAQKIDLTRQHLCQQFGLRGSAVSAERLHVTLHHLGDHCLIPPSLVPNVIKACDSFRFPEVDLVFDTAMRFASNQRKPMLVLTGDKQNMAALCELNRLLAQTLTRAGAGEWLHKSFTPHITLLYGAAELPTTEIDPIRWTANQFVLIHSLLRQTTHISLANWSLHTVRDQDD